MSAGGWGRSRGWGGRIINHGWDFIKLRLSCAQCIVYYLVLRGGFAQLGNIPVRSSALSALSRTPRSWRRGGGSLRGGLVVAALAVRLGSLSEN